MNTSLLVPITGNALTDALREYEVAHEVWMNTSVFTDAGSEAKRVKDAAHSLALKRLNDVLRDFDESE